MGTRRWRPALLGALVLVLAIVMCIWIVRAGAPNALDSMQENFQQQAGIDRATDKIGQLPGVASVDIDRADGKPKAASPDARRAHVHIRVTTDASITLPQLTAVAQSVRAAWADRALAATVGDGVITH